MSHADMNNCCGLTKLPHRSHGTARKRPLTLIGPGGSCAGFYAFKPDHSVRCDNEQEQLRREALSDQVWERFSLMNPVILSSAKWNRISSLSGKAGA